MTHHVDFLMKCALFDRISEKDLLTILDCLRAQILTAEKGKTILHQGDPCRHFGVLLSGSAHVTHIGENGNHIIIAHISPGDLFAETFACSKSDTLPVGIIADEPCTFLQLECKRVITGCRNGCLAHSLLVTNLMSMIAHKNILLSQKLQVVMQRTTREKLLAYLRQQATHAKGRRFSIPFDRQQLADYLGVDRSAMSTELNRMKREGIITFSRNTFELLTETI